MPRIALADDHPIVRRGFKQLIETVPGYVVDSWYALYARAGTPQQVVDKIADAASKFDVTFDTITYAEGLELMGPVRNPNENRPV